MWPKPSNCFPLWDGVCQTAPDIISISSARFLDARYFLWDSSETSSRVGKIQTEAYRIFRLTRVTRIFRKSVFTETTRGYPPSGAALSPTGYRRGMIACANRSSAARILFPSKRSACNARGGHPRQGRRAADRACVFVALQAVSYGVFR